MPVVTPRRGDLYWAELDPVVGREQAGSRPFLVLSLTEMNRARLAMAIGLPITTTPRDNTLHVRIEPGNSGLAKVSYAMPEMVRSVSTLRLGGYIGRAPEKLLDKAAQNTGFLLGLGQIRF